MNNNKRVAIFDFDDTLFVGQSHSEFISYLESKLSIYKFFYAKLRKRFEPRPLNDKMHKEFLLKPYNGYSQKWIDKMANSFYNNVVRKRFNEKVISQFNNHKAEGYMTIIASGGFDVYLKYFKLDFKPDLLICTELEFNNNLFTAKIKGEEVLFENKVKQIKLNLNEDEIDWKESYAYSDHISDLPLFNLVGNKVLIDIGQDKRWITKDFKVI